MRDHPPERSPWWETTLLRDHPDERQACWVTSLLRDHPDEKPPGWVTCLLRDHPAERPPCRETTLLRDHPVEWHASWETTLLRDHPVERPPCWETTLLSDMPVEDHPVESTLLNDMPVERQPWETTLLRDHPDNSLAAMITCTHTVFMAVKKSRINTIQHYAPLLSFNDPESCDDECGFATDRHEHSLDDDPQLFPQLLWQFLHLSEVAIQHLKKEGKLKNAALVWLLWSTRETNFNFQNSDLRLVNHDKQHTGCFNMNWCQ